MEQAFSFCAERVREADRDRFLATLFAPERHRGPLFALYAFDAEIAEVRKRITQPLAGEVRLQWWRDVIRGTAASDAAGHPIAAALLDVIRRVALPAPALLDLIDAHTFDLYDEPMATLVQLENYSAATSAAVIRFAACILNEGTEPGLDALFRHAGLAVTIAAILEDLPLHSARGQRFLPDDVLARHGAAPGDVQAGRATCELRAALAELREIGRSHLAALGTEGGAPLRLLPALLPVAPIAARLARMGSKGADPFRPRTVPPWRRQWILWRAARNPSRFIRVRPDGPGENGGRG